MGSWTEDLERAIKGEIDARITGLRRSVNKKDVYNIMARLQIEAKKDADFREDMRQFLKSILGEGI